MTGLVDMFWSTQENKSKWTNSSSGKDFEDRIINELKRNGFSRGLQDDSVLRKYLKENKEFLQGKSGSSLLPNTLKEQGNEYENMFVWQPFGSQNFPDFLVFTKHKIFSIEVKYTTNDAKKPMWNSNLPKSDGIYIFGNYGSKDITFFRGEDILPDNERVILLDFWKETDIAMENFEKSYRDMLAMGEIKVEYGFFPYIRKAFDQKQLQNPDARLNYFTNTNRSELEENVISFIRSNDIACLEGNPELTSENEERELTSVGSGIGFSLSDLRNAENKKIK